VKNLAVGLILCFFIGGCVTSSKTTKPTTCVAEEKATVLEKEDVSQRCPFIAEAVAAKSPITYSGITDVIDVFFEIKSEEAGFGGTKFSGTSDNTLMDLEMAGQKDEISQASLKLSYPEGIGEVDSDLNNAVMLRFLKNAAPGYKEWPKDVIRV